MKVVPVLLSLLSLAVACSYAEVHSVEQLTAYNYHMKYGVPLALKIKRTEEDAANAGLAGQRIIGGSVTDISQVPYQVGLLNQLPLNLQSVGGGVLISRNRVVTAAQNHFDGVTFAQSHTVVLGSNTIFSGGHRQTTRDIVLHPNFHPIRLFHDIAVIRINNVVFSVVIRPISLPFPHELNDNLVGEIAMASGYGIIADGATISVNQTLSSVSLPIISYNECAQVYGGFVLLSNICTSGQGGRNICRGDMGGPLVIQSRIRRVLVGITSFVSFTGCETGSPAMYSRVASYRSWLLSI